MVVAFCSRKINKKIGIWLAMAESYVFTCVQYFNVRLCLEVFL